MTICPTCHQPVRNARMGVFLSPRRAEVVDAIRQAGEHGIELCGLADQLGITRWTVKSHVYQINEMLAETDWRIRSDRCGYRLVRQGR
jgi:DNA-binding NarL/FixJ family response regulator